MPLSRNTWRTCSAVFEACLVGVLRGILLTRDVELDDGSVRAHSNLPSALRKWNLQGGQGGGVPGKGSGGEG